MESESSSSRCTQRCYTPPHCSRLSAPLVVHQQCIGGLLEEMPEPLLTLLNLLPSLYFSAS
jgi:hypothetical protein